MTEPTGRPSRLLLVGCALFALARVAHAQDAGGGPADGGAPADGASDAPLPAEPEAPPAPPQATPPAEPAAAPAPATPPAEPPPAAPAAPPSAEPAPPPPALTVPRVDVIGRAPRALDHIPGTAQVVKREDLRQLAAQNAGEALRVVPGLNVVPESDGMGLRLNVGIRGLDPNRSRKVLILEDGMPVSLSPYGSPELYYSPPIERMDHVEVVKGSGQILWGPQTIGGVINFITRDPPRRLGANADLRYGSYGYLLAQAGVGATHKQVGWRVDVFHRRFDGPRRLDLALTDVSGKLRIQLTPRSVLGLKLSFYDEQSRATYLGLTREQYAIDPAFNFAENDRFIVRRYALGLTHQHFFRDNLLLHTTVYAYETTRDWRRQDFDWAPRPGADYERVCDPSGRCGALGDPGIMPTTDGSSIYFRRQTGHHNRAFQVVGVEPRLSWNWTAPRDVRGELIALVRFHYERARDTLLIGSHPRTHTGDPREDEQRNGYALAAAVQNRFIFLKRLHVTPGIRFENFWTDRLVMRAPVMTPTGTVGGDADAFGRSFSWAVIPGLGVSADVAGPLTLYAGVHRGYAPPRTKDSIRGDGTVLQLDPELSWNFELGARLRLADWLAADVAAFHMEFENQIIPVSVSGGVDGASFNSGHSRHTGLEATVTFDLAPLVMRERTSFALPLSVNYTYLPLAAFVGGVTDGNRLPYAPEHLVWAQLRFVHRLGISAQLGLSYVSSQFAEKSNAIAATPDGLIGLLPGYAVLDARVAYTFRRAGLTLYVAGKGLTGEVYIASRAPQGIQPAGFRQIFGGVEWVWPPRR